MEVRNEKYLTADCVTLLVKMAYYLRKLQILNIGGVT